MSATTVKRATITKFTTEGVNALGDLIRNSRVAKKWSIKFLQEKLSALMGEPIGWTTLQNLEKPPKDKTPNWELINAIASLGMICKENGTPYSTQELMLVACGKHLDYRELKRLTVEHLTDIYQNQGAMFFDQQSPPQPVIPIFVEEIIEQEPIEVARDVIRVWYAWVTCNGKTCCRKYTLDSSGKTSSEEVSDSYCR